MTTGIGQFVALIVWLHTLRAASYPEVVGSDGNPIPVIRCTALLAFPPKP